VVSKVFNQNLPQLRRQLIQYIGGFLEGDALAAEFLFLNLFSSMYDHLYPSLLLVSLHFLPLTPTFLLPTLFFFFFFMLVT